MNRVAPVPGGPLSEVGNGYGAPSQADVPLTAGAFSLHNDGGRKLVVEDIELPEPDGIDYLGVVARRDGSAGPAFPVESGFPPAGPAVSVGRVRPAEGLRVGPHDVTQLLIGFQGEPGAYRMTPVEVVYRLELLGRLGVRFRREITTQLGVCLGRGAAGPRCEPPPFSD